MNEISEISENVPYKMEAYETFLKLLEEDYLYNWKALANVLRVDPRTLFEWRKSPRAQAIFNKEIKRLIGEMERAGEGDWRMYREKAKIMGVDDVIKVEAVDTKSILDELEGKTDYANLGKRAMIEIDEKDQNIGEKPE